MRKCNRLNNLFNHNRKVLYIILSIVMISVLTLTIVYAALSTTLQIDGQAEVSSASWDIHFDNIKINQGSVEGVTSPKIIDSRTINFVVELKEPGDYYKFTVDIVNNGTIDAMIDSVVKTPTLTETQAKYLKYEIEYTDGNSILDKQLLPKETSKTMSVLVAYRSDVASSDIPTTGESLNLSFTMIYTQADETSTQIPESTPLVRIVNGDINTVGSEICIGEECFYLMENDGKSVTMLSKYNLLVGNNVDSDGVATPIKNPTGIQDSTAIGAMFDSEGNPTNYPWIGMTEFAPNAYWSSNTNFPIYIYNSNSYLYTYVENYKQYIKNFDIQIEEARLITYEEIVNFGCPKNFGKCSEETPTWLYATTYWTGAAANSSYALRMFSRGSVGDDASRYLFGAGIRPVIKISLSNF